MFIVGFIIYRIFFPQPNVACIYDAYQSATESANRAMVDDRSTSAFEGNSNQLSLTGRAMIGTGQVLMDLWIGVLGVVW